ncbi:hypothetical protein NE237_005070 [Protea cynaroides]|uniref:Uncharacterized protein n=1 Tax=Protea cynaroides TaxID=273540 RepID=A0A9Q0KKN4_9MAGN|nr:hypothetical protein NE237_005070 [Protea cynaroides]
MSSSVSQSSTDACSFARWIEDVDSSSYYVVPSTVFKLGTSSYYISSATTNQPTYVTESVAQRVEMDSAPAAPVIFSNIAPLHVSYSSDANLHSTCNPVIQRGDESVVQAPNSIQSNTTAVLPTENEIETPAVPTIVDIVVTSDMVLATEDEIETLSNCVERMVESTLINDAAEFVQRTVKETLNIDATDKTTLVCHNSVVFSKLLPESPCPAPSEWNQMCSKEGSSSKRECVKEPMDVELWIGGNKNEGMNAEADDDV